MYVHTMFVVKINMHVVCVYTVTAVCRCNHDYCLLQHKLKNECVCVLQYITMSSILERSSAPVVQMWWYCVTSGDPAASSRPGEYMRSTTNDFGLPSFNRVTSFQ